MRSGSTWSCGSSTATSPLLSPSIPPSRSGSAPVVSKNEVKKILKVLTEDESSMAANWSRRFKNNMEKLHSGDPYQVAEVLRNLAIRDREKGLSAGEKRMITKARQILISELSYATGKSEDEAEVMIDEVLDGAHGVKVGRPGLTVSTRSPHGLSSQCLRSPAPASDDFDGGGTVRTSLVGVGWKRGDGRADAEGRKSSAARAPGRGRPLDLHRPVRDRSGFSSVSAATADQRPAALLYVFLGAGVGYVIGGVFGRLTLRAVTGLEQELRRTPGRRSSPAASSGWSSGSSSPRLLMIPLLFLPASAAWPALVFVYLVARVRSGSALGQAKYEDIFGLVGMKPRAAVASRGDLHVIDTSALIDGRVADLVATGFVAGTMLLHDGVLRELQSISDSSDPRRRTRGRRGLDVLVELQKSPTVQLQLVEEVGVMDVDAALVRLARERGGTLITVDHNLAKVAEALRVPVAQINALASKFRVPYAAGDEISVRLVKEGREHGQGVGYLDDGTMVVVEKATEQIGTQVDVRVTNVIQTTTGRMVFAALAEVDA